MREALAEGLGLELVLATPDFLATADGAALVPRLPRAVDQVAPDLLASVTDADSPRGIIAVARRPYHRVGDLPVVHGGLYLYTDRLQDPGNLGALARTAEAAGVVALALSPGTADPHHPRALRASAGSLLRLPAALETSAEALSDHLSSASPRWLALAPRGGTDLYEASPGGTLILAVGSEGRGLSEALLQRAEVAVTIPLEPPVESLNATVAAALVLFELRRRRGRETA